MLAGAEAFDAHGKNGQVPLHASGQVMVKGLYMLVACGVGTAQLQALIQGAKGKGDVVAGAAAKGLKTGNSEAVGRAPNPGQNTVGALLGTDAALPASAVFQAAVMRSVAMVDAAIAVEAMDVAKPNHWRANSA